MRVIKPASVWTKSFLFRPRKPLHGNFSIGLAIDSPAGGATAATCEWCGSKRQLAFGAALSGFVTNLRLPLNLSEGDVYVLSVSAPAVLFISLNINGDVQAVEHIAIEETEDGPGVPTVCADPTTTGDRKFEDQLAAANPVKPALHPATLGRIESLRAFPEGGVLILIFRRPTGDASRPDFNIYVSVGEMRRPCIMAAWQAETSICLRLQATAAGETWPLTFTSNHAFTWSGSVHRNFDLNFLPAFSLAT